MQTALITGSTRGIGYGMAEAFLRSGWAVVINGRRQESVDQAVAQLSQDFDANCILGVPGDISQLETHQHLWDRAVERFGRVDIWINNAALEKRSDQLWDQSEEAVHTVVDANLKGIIWACQVAVKGMLEQGGGHIYNMEGLGSQGRIEKGVTLYSTTKYGLSFLTRALVKETEDLPVKVSFLNPGMVVTDMLMNSVAPERMERAKRIFNILADPVEDVSSWLVEQIIKNDQHGARIEWLTRSKIFLRFLKSPFTKRDIFAGTKWE